MASGTKLVEQAIQEIITGWSTEAPEASFGGMTLAQYKLKVKPSTDARDEVTRLEAQLKAAISTREDADKVSNDANHLVVNAVKGDPNYGEDSTVYEAMGYVRKSERKSGLKKAKKAAPAPPK